MLLRKKYLTECHQILGLTADPPISQPTADTNSLAGQTTGDTNSLAGQTTGDTNSFNGQPTGAPDSGDTNSFNDQPQEATAIATDSATDANLTSQATSLAEPPASAGVPVSLDPLNGQPTGVPDSFEDSGIDANLTLLIVAVIAANADTSNELDDNLQKGVPTYRCAKCDQIMTCIERARRPSWKNTFRGPHRPTWYSRPPPAPSKPRPPPELVKVSS